MPRRMKNIQLNFAGSTDKSIRNAGFSSVDKEHFETHQLMENGSHARLIRSHISGTANK